MYDTLVSKVTEGVMEEVITWQNRPLDSVYPPLFLGCIVVKIREDKRVINKSVYLALAINLEGRAARPGSLRTKARVLNECSDGTPESWRDKISSLPALMALSGFPEAIEATFPDTKVQLCAAYQIRNSLKYVSYKDRKTVAADLKSIYQSVSEEEARMRPEMGFTVSLYQQRLAIKLGKSDKPVYYQCD